MPERYLQRCQGKSFAIRAYAMSAVSIIVVNVHKLFAYSVVSAVCIDVVSSHIKYCIIAYGITGKQNPFEGTSERMTSDFMAFLLYFN